MHSAVDRGGDFRLVRRLEEEAVRSARRDPVDQRRQIGDPRNLAEMVAGAKDRRAQCRHFVFERDTNGFGKTVRGLHDDIDQEFAPG